jgi:UDP:flavonoid glycosyltransferase YjiC (YdhE family)
VAAFGDPGHAFPAIALGRGLVQRGHDVCLETWSKWREHVEREGMRFAAAPEYQVFPTGDTMGLKPYQAAVRASGETRELIEDFDPEVVVADILTVAAALAGELSGRPWATLIPHVLPLFEPGWPPYSAGARIPRTALGRAMWRGFDPLLRGGLERGRVDLNGARARVGLPPLDYVHGGISRELALIATFPQLEYPRAWPPGAHVVGPLLWEPPAGAVALPPGDEPLVLLAPSTSQDAEHRLLRAALAGLADLPVRVLASTNSRRPGAPFAVPPNARLVDWVSYGRTMPACDLVVCHGGHGTLARALASGCAVVVVPAAGDMNESAARVDWAGVGVRLPRRMVAPRAIALAVGRALARPQLRARARELQAWAAVNDGAQRAADHVEALVSGMRVSPLELADGGGDVPAGSERLHGHRTRS